MTRAQPRDATEIGVSTELGRYAETVASRCLAVTSMMVVVTATGDGPGSGGKP